VLRGVPGSQGRSSCSTRFCRQTIAWAVSRMCRRCCWRERFRATSAIPVLRVRWGARCAVAGGLLRCGGGAVNAASTNRGVQDFGVPRPVLGLWCKIDDRSWVWCCGTSCGCSGVSNVGEADSALLFHPGERSPDGNTTGAPALDQNRRSM
jgi:hypothetical protein